MLFQAGMLSRVERGGCLRWMKSFFVEAAFCKLEPSVFNTCIVWFGVLGELFLSQTWDPLPRRAEACQAPRGAKRPILWRLKASIISLQCWG